MTEDYSKYYEGGLRAINKKKVLEIFRMWNEGVLGKRAIAKRLDIGINTVTRYLKKAGLE